MTNTVLFKRSGTAGKIPTTTSLAVGEIAQNIYDGKMFIHGNNGTDFIGTIGATTISGDVSGAITGARGATAVLTLGNSGVAAGTFAGLVVNAKGLVTSGTAFTTLGGYGITDAVAASRLGAASGVATLDSGGHVTAAQLPASLVGAMNYQGTWNASTNTPALASGTGTKGYYYKVSTAGTTSLDGVASWNVGDSAVFDGTTWDKIDGITNEILSVFGRTGVVVGQAGDYSGIYLTGNQTITVSGDATGSGTTTLALTLAGSGATAGTFAGLTVNAKGLVTATAALTTLGGYGIVDAVQVNATIDLGSY